MSLITKAKHYLQKKKRIPEELEHYANYLSNKAYADNTRKKYLRDVKTILTHLGNQELEEENLQRIVFTLEATYKTSSVVSMVASLTNYLTYKGRSDIKVKAPKLQRRLFREESEELTETEYERLKTHAKLLDMRLYLIVEILAATGIRISELDYITLEAALKRRVKVTNKGKERTIFLPKKLAQKLLAYAKKKGITQGSLIVTATGTSVDRSNIWKELKRLAVISGVDKDKVYPHNFRHLFATVHYKTHKNLSHLADVLGHSSVETTRIYIATSGAEHSQEVECLGLVA